MGKVDFIGLGGLVIVYGKCDIMMVEFVVCLFFIVVYFGLVIGFIGFFCGFILFF